MNNNNNPRQRHYVSCFDGVWSMNEASFRELCTEQIANGEVDLDNHGKQLAKGTARRILREGFERVIDATDGFDAAWELECLDMEPVYRLGE